MLHVGLKVNQRPDRLQRFTEWQLTTKQTVNVLKTDDASTFAATAEFKCLKYTAKGRGGTPQRERDSGARRHAEHNRADKWVCDRLWARGQRARARWCWRRAGSLGSFSFHGVMYSHWRLGQTHTGWKGKSKRYLGPEAQAQLMICLDSAAIRHHMRDFFHGKRWPGSEYLN